MRRTSKDRKGVAATEFAVIVPIILAFVTGIIEMGRALEVQQMMRIAVREGARLGAMEVVEFDVPNEDPIYFETTNAKVETDIRNYLTASGVDSTNLTFDLDEITIATDGTITVVDENFDISGDNDDLPYYRVTITIPFDDLAYMPATFLRGQDLTASIVMRAARRASLNGG